MKKKVFALLLISIMMWTMLAGCGKDGDNGGSSVEENIRESAEEHSEDETSVEEAGSESSISEQESVTESGESISEEVSILKDGVMSTLG